MAELVLESIGFGLEISKILWFFVGKGINLLPDEIEFYFELKKFVKSDTQKIHELLKGEANEKVFELINAVAEIYKDILEIFPEGDTFTNEEIEVKIRDISNPTQWSLTLQHFEDARKIATKVFNAPGVKPVSRLSAMRIMLFCNVILRRRQNSALMLSLEQLVWHVFHNRELMRCTFYGLLKNNRLAQDEVKQLFENAADSEDQKTQLRQIFDGMMTEVHGEEGNENVEILKGIRQILAQIENTAVYSWTPSTTEKFSSLMLLLRNPPMDIFEIFLRANLRKKMRKALPNIFHRWFHAEREEKPRPESNIRKAFSTLHTSLIKEIKVGDKVHFFREYINYRRAMPLSNSHVLLVRGSVIFHAVDICARKIRAAMQFPVPCQFGVLWDQDEKRDLILTRQEMSGIINVFAFSGTNQFIPLPGDQSIHLKEEWAQMKSIELIAVNPGIVLVKPENSAELYIHELDHSSNKLVTWSKLTITLHKNDLLRAADIDEKSGLLTLITTNFDDATKRTVVTIHKQQPGPTNGFSPTKIHPHLSDLPKDSRAVNLIPDLGLSMVQYQTHKSGEEVRKYLNYQRVLENPLNVEQGFDHGSEESGEIADANQAKSFCKVKGIICVAFDNFHLSKDATEFEMSKMPVSRSRN